MTSIADQALIDFLAAQKESTHPPNAHAAKIIEGWNGSPTCVGCSYEMRESMLDVSSRVQDVLDSITVIHPDYPVAIGTYCKEGPCER